MKTLKDVYEEEKKLLINDAEEIRSASFWTQQEYILYHGNVGDSSKRSNKRSDFVKQAVKIFTEEHKKEILELAAKLCIESIGE